MSAQRWPRRTATSSCTLVRVDRLAAGRRAAGPANRSKIIRVAVRQYLARLERLAHEDLERGILRRHARRLAREAAALVRAQARP